MNFNKATLETIGDGKAIDKFNFELDRAIENCLDINKAPEAVRTVTLTVKIKPTNDRKAAAITFQADAKLAPDSSGVDQILFARDGAFVSNSRQLTIDEYGDKVEEIDREKEEGTND